MPSPTHSKIINIHWYLRNSFFSIFSILNSRKTWILHWMHTITNIFSTMKIKVFFWKSPPHPPLGSGFCIDTFIPEKRNICKELLWERCASRRIYQLADVLNIHITYFWPDLTKIFGKNTSKKRPAKPPPKKRNSHIYEIISKVDLNGFTTDGGFWKVLQIGMFYSDQVVSGSSKNSWK
jgi:hypothetical protein